MKLIGAGLPRTGTLSQKVALEMLGVGPTYHMMNVLMDLDQANLWKRALAGDGPWDEIFDGFQSTVDAPGHHFYKELMGVYPDAKVLLSTRDPEKWRTSMEQTVWAVRNGGSTMRLLSDARGTVDPGWAGFLEMIDGLLWEGDGSLADCKDNADGLPAAMERWTEEVKANVPADRLLVWDVTQGWEPLCEFLELPVPSDPFPNVNDSKEFVERMADGALAKLQEWRNSGDLSSTAPLASSASTA
jgi:sulfotransferase family protein